MHKVLFAVALFAVATPAFAATNAYTPPCADSDIAIHNQSNTEVVSCIPRVDWDEAHKPRPESALMSLVPGQTVTLVSSRTDICPTWYFMGCTIDRTLVQ